MFSEDSVLSRLERLETKIENLERKAIFKSPIVNKSKTIGKTYADTKTFDDYLDSQKKIRKIKQIRINSNSYGLYSFQCRYELENGFYENDKLGSENKGRDPEEVLVLKDDEYVVSLKINSKPKGHENCFVRGVEIKTNKGTNLLFGIREGVFEELLPGNEKLFAVGGATNGHLHLLFAYSTEITE